MKDSSREIYETLFSLEYRYGAGKLNAEEVRKMEEYQKFTGRIPVRTTVDMDKNEVALERFRAMSFGPCNF